MLIRKKSNEEILTQAESYLNYSVKTGKIGKDVKEKILNIILSDVDDKKGYFNTRENTKNHLSDVLNPEEFDKFYCDYKNYLKIKNKISKMLPKEYGVIVDDILQNFSKEKNLSLDDNEIINEILKLKTRIELINSICIINKNKISKIKEIIISGKNQNLLELKDVIKNIGDLIKLKKVIISGRNVFEEGENKNNLNILINIGGINEVDDIHELEFLIINLRPKIIKKLIEILKDEGYISPKDLVSKINDIVGGNKDEVLSELKRISIEELKSRIKSKTNINKNELTEEEKAKLNEIVLKSKTIYINGEELNNIETLKNIGGITNDRDLLELEYIIINVNALVTKTIVETLIELGFSNPEKLSLELKKLVRGKENNILSKKGRITKQEAEDNILSMYNTKSAEKKGTDESQGNKRINNGNDVRENLNNNDEKLRIFVSKLREKIKIELLSNTNNVSKAKMFGGILDSGYNNATKHKIIRKITGLPTEEAKKYYDIIILFDESISMDIKRVKNELVDEILKLEDFEDVQDISHQIMNIFVRNNIPLTGKVFKVFEILYPKTRIRQLYKECPYSSPILKSLLDDGNKIYELIYKDLMNIAIKSGEHSLKEYIKSFIRTEEILKKFEKIISEKGFNKNDKLCLEGKMKEKDQEKLLYMFRKISVIYSIYYGKEIDEDKMIERIKLGESNVIDNILINFYEDIRKKLHVKNGESIYERIEKFLYGLGYKSFEEVLEQMNKAKRGAHERGLKRYNNNFEYKDMPFPRKAFSKGITKDCFQKILERGIVSTEYLGGGDDGIGWMEGGSGAGSTKTPFDIDGRYTAKKCDDDEYGNISLIVDMNRRGKGEYESFMTLLGNTHYGLHYGIRTGIPTTEIDYIIYNGEYDEIKEIINDDGKKIKCLNTFQNMCYDIAKNGYYIPIVDKELRIIFTPEMYHHIRKCFNFTEYYDGFDVELKDGKYILKENTENINSEGNDELLKFNNNDIEERDISESVIIMNYLKGILEEKGGIHLNSEFDESLLGAEIFDSGSTGRGTNIESEKNKKIYTLLLDSDEYEKLKYTVKILRKEKGIKQIKYNGSNKIDILLDNELINTNSKKIEIQIIKKSEIIDYTSSESIKEKLKYIKDKLGEEKLKGVKLNIVTLKKLLNAIGLFEIEGGFSGLCVENRILQNHGNLIETLESFEKVAYGGYYQKGKKPLPFDEFKKVYAIYDAGENYMDKCNDNFIYRLNVKGYNGILKIIQTYRLKGIEGLKQIILNN